MCLILTKNHLFITNKWANYCYRRVAFDSPNIGRNILKKCKNQHNMQQLFETLSAFRMMNFWRLCIHVYSCVWQNLIRPCWLELRIISNVNLFITAFCNNFVDTKIANKWGKLKSKDKFSMAIAFVVKWIPTDISLFVWPTFYKIKRCVQIVFFMCLEYFQKFWQFTIHIHATHAQCFLNVFPFNKSQNGKVHNTNMHLLYEYNTYEIEIIIAYIHGIGIVYYEQHTNPKAWVPRQCQNLRLFLWSLEQTNTIVIATNTIWSCSLREESSAYFPIILFKRKSVCSR